MNVITGLETTPCFKAQTQNISCLHLLSLITLLTPDVPNIHKRSAAYFHHRALQGLQTVADDISELFGSRSLLKEFR